MTRLSSTTCEVAEAGDSAMCRELSNRNSYRTSTETHMRACMWKRQVWLVARACVVQVVNGPLGSTIGKDKHLLLSRSSYTGLLPDQSAMIVQSCKGIQIQQAPLRCSGSILGQEPLLLPSHSRAPFRPWRQYRQQRRRRGLPIRASSSNGNGSGPSHSSNGKHSNGDKSGSNASSKSLDERILSGEVGRLLGWLLQCAHWIWCTSSVHSGTFVFDFSLSAAVHCSSLTRAPLRKGSRGQFGKL